MRNRKYPIGKMQAYLAGVPYMEGFKEKLKVHDTAQEALELIDKKGYTFPYKTDGRRVVKVGVKFNAGTRAPEDWIVSSEAVAARRSHF